MRRLWLLLPLAALFSGLAAAETPEEIFSRGNAAYENGRFGEAVEAYRSLVRYGIRDFRVDYNLGCAAFRLGRIGESILHFERAQRLAPTDGDVQANLDLARSRCFDRVEEPEAAHALRWIRWSQDRAGPDRQVMLGVALLWVACGIVAWRAARPGAWTGTAGWSLAACLLLGALVGLSWRSTRARLEAPAAIVLEAIVDVRAGPGEHNATLFTAHEGLKLAVRGERPGWVQVSLPNGLNGWVPAAAVGRV